MKYTHNLHHEFLRRAAFVACVCCLAGWMTAAGAQSVAMVMDVAGTPTRHGGGAPAGIAILTEIEPDTRVQLDSSARLEVIYLKSGDVYAFTGPAQILFQADAPQILSGAPSRKRATRYGAHSPDVVIKPFGVSLGSTVMRNAPPAARIKLLNLAGTRTLETHPEFRWQGAGPGLRYQFELNDDTDKSLFQTQVEDVALKLPPAIRLREGIGYTWTVATRLADGRRYVNSGDFRIAPADLRTRVEALRPASGAPVSERVAFAAWLAQAELRDEARKYWRTLAAERPAEPRLKALAAE